MDIFNVKETLQIIGEDPNREGLLETPSRVAKMYNEVFSGYSQDVSEVFKVFEEGHTEMVIVQDIDFYSHCEHHMVPFFGKVHIGYIPNGKVAGLSKFVRLVELYAKRLQVQERLTTQIADAIMVHLGAQGCMVVIEAEHMCMKMRGVRNATSLTKTSAVRGNFEQSETRREFLGLIK